MEAALVDDEDSIFHNSNLIANADGSGGEVV